MLTKYSLIIRPLTSHDFFVIVHNFIVLAGNLSWRRACCGWLCHFWLCFYLFLSFLSLLRPTHSPIVSALIILQSLILNLESLYYKDQLGDKLQGIGNLFSWRFLFEILLMHYTEMTAYFSLQHYKLCKQSKKCHWCVPDCILMYYSITLCSINSAISVFTLKIPNRNYISASV